MSTNTRTVGNTTKPGSPVWGTLSDLSKITGIKPSYRVRSFTEGVRTIKRGTSRQALRLYSVADVLAAIERSSSIATKGC